MKSHKWHDAYTVRARKEGFPARSVYKLAEIQKRFQLLVKGGRVLDLGCSPGSWLLFASRAVGKRGRVVGVDLNPLSIPLPANAEFIAGDILQWDEQVIKESLEGPFDVVLSDMAPACTGHKFVDVQRSLALCRCALSVCHSVLRPGGSLVCKVFQGPDVDAFGGEVKALFSRMTHVRPKSTRKASKEVYILGIEKCGYLKSSS